MWGVSPEGRLREGSGCGPASFMSTVYQSRGGIS